ncbi:unnamed protein product [Blepharisma stoltei]|uniref:Uncharacterized protein n=1 Tax=Blepharisma stoltei TaxID=1481888 RepID=A0AAU9JAG7_9CILI|nr:unnamed protein product [Blepharisma stoltei]
MSLINMGCVESYKEHEEIDISNDPPKLTRSALNMLSTEDQFDDIDLESPKEFYISPQSVKGNDEFSDHESLVGTVRSTCVSFHRNENELAFLIPSPRIRKQSDFL